MSVTCFSAVVATPGTPQRLISSTVPAQAALTSGGVTSAAGSAGVAGSFVSLQAGPSNTAAKNIYIGGPTMNVAAKTGIGLALLTGAPPVSLDFSNGEITLDDLWIDTDSVTAGNERVYVMLAG